MRFVKNELAIQSVEKMKYKHTPTFAPAGQSTQMIVGATNETDQKIIDVASYMYGKLQMKRVYYSGYVPVLEDSRLPSIHTQVPVVRENRLYQADWLMRYYGFAPNELLDPAHPFFGFGDRPQTGVGIASSGFFSDRCEYGSS